MRDADTHQEHPTHPTPPGPADDRADAAGPFHPRPELGSRGVFAGDWATYRHSDDTMRVPVGFVGTLIDVWNGHAVFACDRQVAEAVVADQQRLRREQRHSLAAGGLGGPDLTVAVDAAYPRMFFDGDDIVVDERAAHGGWGLSRIAPDGHGRYIVNGWNWTWQAVDPADCDRVAGHLYDDLTPSGDRG